MPFIIKDAGRTAMVTTEAMVAAMISTLSPAMLQTVLARALTQQQQQPMIGWELQHVIPAGGSAPNGRIG